MNEKKQTGLRDSFRSKTGFIIACIGSAVGMGNIWLFPYRTGQFGGAAFLIPYFSLSSYWDFPVWQEKWHSDGHREPALWGLFPTR